MKARRLEALVEYITNRKYLCKFCINLQKRVVLHGLDEINKYTGIMCSSISGMKIRLQEAETGKSEDEED